MSKYTTIGHRPSAIGCRLFLNRFLLFAICYLLFATASFAQKISIKGSVRDTANRSIEGATIMLMLPKDSSLVTFGRSQSGGNFELKNLDNQPFLLKITYMGLKPFSKIIEPANSDLGIIKLEAIPKNLDEVIIRGERNPVTINKDTIEYNAGSFKVQQNAVVEDLLKKLPGVEVAKDGTITAQGQKVQRVTVDGREFFGRDPKMATKNLPADAVDKVKVYDRQSDQASFTGIDDGQREKTIDLKIKEEKKKMAFGNVMSGLGNDQRYVARANINKFNKSRQLSFLGMANNINEQGFSMSDYMNFTGAARQMMSGGSLRLSFRSGDDSDIPLNFGGRPTGFQTNWSGGLNYSDQFNKKTDLQSSYFYNKTNQLVDKETITQSFAGANSFNSNRNTNQITNNENHRLNLTLEHKIDSANTIKWTNRAVFGQSSSNIGSNSVNIGATSKLRQSEGERKTESGGTSNKLTSELIYRHRFAKKGRNMSAILNFGLNNSDRNGDVRAKNTFFDNKGLLNRIDTINQTNTQITNQNSFGVTLSLTEPIAKRQYLEMNYSYQKAINDVNRQVFDVKESNKSTFNTQLSNQFESAFSYQKAGTNYRLANKNDNLTAGVALQQSTIEGNLILKKTQIAQKYLNLLPSIDYRHNFENSKNLQINYNTSIQSPDIQQLSPIVDNTDPLNIMEGNPNLRPEYSHQISSNFSQFNSLNFSSFFLSINFNYTINNIVNAQWIAQNAIRTYRPINVRDDYNVSGNLSKGFRIKALKSRFNVSTNLTFNRGLTMINDIENRTLQRNSRNSFRWDYTLGDAFDLSGSASVTFNNTKYSQNPAQNQSFKNQNYELEANWHISKTLHFNTNYDYAIYEYPNSTFSQRIPLWNMSLSKNFLKNNRGELKFLVNDLLNRNVVINRYAAGNFVQDERTRSLARYFLLTFTYKLGGVSGMSSGGTIRMIRN